MQLGRLALLQNPLKKGRITRRFDIALLFLKQCAAASYRVKHSVETVQDCALLWFCVVNGINNSVFWLPNLGSNQGPTD